MLDESLPPEVSEIMEATGANPLKAWRIYRGYSIEYVASLMEVMPHRFEVWEKSISPCNDMLQKLARFYDCRVSELIP